jgi:hypothetical protein
MDKMLGLKITRPLVFTLQLVIAIIALTGGSAWPQAAPVNEARSLTIDMPYGACRLTVLEDGSARLYYGELLQHVPIKKGTFDLDDLNASIRNRVSSIGADRLKLAPPVGSVQLGVQAGTLWFNDEAFAQSLFQKAWVNRLHGILPVQLRDQKLLSRFCKIQE